MGNESIFADLRKVIEELMEKKSVKSFHLEIEEQSGTGENYLGNIVFFKIFTECETYNFVMKKAQQSEKLRKKVPIKNAYERETFMYFEVFPAFKRFIEKTSFEFDFVPEIHYKISEPTKETLIFTNLKSEGYKLCDRKKPWNLEHSLLAMEYYGKFHAISLAFNDQKPDDFKNLTKNLNNFTDEFISHDAAEHFYNGYIANVMKLLKKIGRDDLVKKYDGLGKEASALMTSKTSNDDKLVICHGDCWNNNYLFKYKGSLDPKPWKMCFVDFQLSTFDSPVYDLSWNIYATCDKSCLDHLDLLLETYYSSLSKNVRCLGSDLDELFSYEDLKIHWQKYAKYGVLLSSFAIKVTLAATEEAPDLAEAAEEGKDFNEIFSFKLKDEAEYDRRVLDVFTHFGDRFM